MPSDSEHISAMSTHGAFTQNLLNSQERICKPKKTLANELLLEYPHSVRKEQTSPGSVSNQIQGIRPDTWLARLQSGKGAAWKRVWSSKTDSCDPGEACGAHC